MEAIDDKLPILSPDCTSELAMGRTKPECVGHVAKISEWVIDGDNSHSARIKNNPGHQSTTVLTIVSQ